MVGSRRVAWVADLRRYSLLVMFRLISCGRRSLSLLPVPFLIYICCYLRCLSTNKSLTTDNTSLFKVSLEVF